MSNTETQEQEQLDQGGIAALREAARKGSAAVDELVELKRRLAFADANIDITHDVGAMLFQTWDGTTPIEDIIAKATKFGAIKGAPAPASTEPTPEQLAEAEAEAARQEIQQQMGGGGQPAGQQQVGPHPMDAALEEYHVSVQKGANEDIARDEAMAKMLSAGHVQHDPRMMFDQQAHNAAAAVADQAANRGKARWAPE